MPALLTVASSMMCPHGGTVTATPGATNALAGAPVLRGSDTFIIAGCSFQVSGVPSPCVSVNWVQTAQKVKHGGALVTEPGQRRPVPRRHSGAARHSADQFNPGEGQRHMIRNDFAVPFRIDAASGQAAQASYQDHVDQMIRQVLLTDPGERVCLPTFGAGLRRLLFAPMSAQLQASAQMIVTQALNAWLSNQITVQKVTVDTPISDPGLQQGVIVITIAYVLIETQSVRQTQVQVI